MRAEEARQVARQLAYEWARVELPTHELTYSDYIQAIAGLYVITDDADRTTALFGAVMDQAKQLGRSSEWVRAELKFEAQAEAIGNRSRWLLTSLKTAGADDSALDAYNDRRNRLIPEH